MGRGKIEIKRIENNTNRQVTFSKRRGGLLKKAHELAILCDAQIGLVIFSSSGKLFEYCNPPSSMRQIIDKYQRVTNTCIDELNDQEQVYCEITRMKHENDRILASMRQYAGEDLSALSLDDLSQLEKQLEISVSKVRARKDQLLLQQIENLRRKEHILEDQNAHLCRIIAEQQAELGQHPQAAVEHKLPDMPMLEHYLYTEDLSRSLLQLSPRLHELRLQPAQPNLQETSLHGHGLQLW